MVQIGITLIEVLSSAFSGATLALRLTSWLFERGLSQGVGDVVTVVTHASLIVGEFACL
jgi:CBS domain containing-hemolysin-like protein